MAIGSIRAWEMEGTVHIGKYASDHLPGSSDRDSASCPGQADPRHRAGYPADQQPCDLHHVLAQPASAVCNLPDCGEPDLVRYLSRSCFGLETGTGDAYGISACISALDAVYLFDLQSIPAETGPLLERKLYACLKHRIFFRVL